MLRVAASEACLKLDARARAEGLHQHVRAEEVRVALDDAGFDPSKDHQLREVLQSKVADACKASEFINSTFLYNTCMIIIYYSSNIAVRGAELGF